MPTDVETLYVPNAPPQDPEAVPRYLDDELNRISQAVQLLNSRLVNAVPWKVFYATLTGITSTTYATTELYNTTAPTRTGVGVYRFTLLYPTFQGIQVAGRSYATVTAEVTPGNKPDPDSVFYLDIVLINPTTGVFDVVLREGHNTAGTKYVLVPYDLKLGDILQVSGNMNLGSDPTPAALKIRQFGEL